MVRLRVCLTLALALMLLGNGAWIPASHTAASDSLAPAGLTAVDWQAVQSQVAKLTTTDGVMGTEFRNAVAASSSTSVALDTNPIHVEEITMGKKVFPHYWYRVFVDVLVHDQYDQPVNKAMVYSEWSLNGGTILEIHWKTDKNGHAVLGLGAGLVGTWEVCVVNVVKSGWSYVPDPMVDLCDTVVVP